MLRIYGYSDDLVEIEDPLEKYTEEIDCYEQDVQITFDDNTVIQIGYSKKHGYEGEWWIERLHKGTAWQQLSPLSETKQLYRDVYSDYFEIAANIKKIEKLKSSF